MCGPSATGCLPVPETMVSSIQSTPEGARERYSWRRRGSPNLLMLTMIWTSSESSSYAGLICLLAHVRDPSSY
jgi:hypothetical protein